MSFMRVQTCLSDTILMIGLSCMHVPMGVHVAVPITQQSCVDVQVTPRIAG